jgi:acetyl-CoA carboxylase biotin carboxyl carrier protein
VELLALTEETADGLRVLSPAVGLWVGIPEPGALVGAGSPIGEIVRLTRRAVLRLPAGVSGRVAHGEPRHLAMAVAWGQELFRLEPLGTGAVESNRGASATGDPAAGTLAVRAPTDGVFYGRPGPGAPPFVSPGDRVRRGQPVGLVEVMKTFNQIVYDGADVPDEAEVVRVCSDDGGEVAAGQVLVVLR